MSDSDYANYLIQKYSLAVAIAVIKSKPENVSLLDFITGLRKNVEKSQNNFDDITVSESDFKNSDDDENNNFNNTDDNNNDDNLLNNSHESVTILRDINLEQYQEEKISHTPIIEIMDMLKSIEQNEEKSNNLNSNSKYHLQPKVTTSTPNNLTQSTFCDSLQSVKNASNVTGNNDITFCPSLSQDNTNPNDFVNQLENNIETIKRLKAPAIITNVFDTQETEIYSVYGFTDNYTHISQSQDNIVLAKKLLHPSVNSNFNVGENNKEEVNSQNNVAVTDVGLSVIRKLEILNQRKLMNSDLTNQNIVCKRKEEQITHDDLKRVKISTNLSFDNQEYNFGKNNEEHSENTFSNYSSLHRYSKNPKNNSTGSSNEFSFIYKEFNDGLEKGNNISRENNTKQSKTKTNTYSRADTDYDFLLSGLNQSNIQCSQNNTNFTLNNTENQNIIRTESEDSLLLRMDERKQLLKVESENSNIISNETVNDFNFSQWNENSEGIQNEKLSNKKIVNDCLHRDQDFGNICNVKTNLINNLTLHKYNNCEWNQNSTGLSNTTTNFINNPTNQTDINDTQWIQNLDQIQNGNNTKINKNDSFRCNQNSTEIQNTTSNVNNNNDNSRWNNKKTAYPINNPTNHRDLICSQRNENVGEILNITTNSNKNPINHKDITCSQLNQNIADIKNLNNPTINKSNSLKSNHQYLAEIQSEKPCQHKEVIEDILNMNSKQNNNDDNLNGCNIDKEIEEDVSNDFTESQAEIITFKVIEEFNKVKNYLIKRDRRVSGEFLTSGYRSNSQSMKSFKTSQSSENWLNESGHCLVNFITHCPLTPRTLKITDEISRNLGQFVDKLHEDENYPSFLEKLLEADLKLLQGIYEESRDNENMLKKEENIERLLLLNRSINIIKYTLEKIIIILEEIHSNVKKDELIELISLEKSENTCYIFHILEILIKRYITISKAISSQSTQPSQNEQKTLKRSDITEIWRKKWNLSKSEVSEGSFKKKCVLSQCSQVLNKIIVDAMDGYSLMSFAALQCFNLLQSK